MSDADVVHLFVVGLYFISLLLVSQALNSVYQSYVKRRRFDRKVLRLLMIFNKMKNLLMNN